MTSSLAAARRWIAGAVGFVIVIPFIIHHVNDPVILIPISMPLIAAIAIHVRRLGAQLLARAAWWSNLVLGVILAATGGGRSDEDMSLYLVLGAGVALLVAGRGSLPAAMEESRYAPAAFRNTLLALMVLALADACTFFLFSFVNRSARLWFFFPMGLGLIVGFIGLLRLRLWGVILNVLISVGALLIIGTKSVHVHEDISAAAVTLCTFQILVAAPMLVSIVLKKPLPAVPQRVSAWAAAGFVVCVMTISIVMAIHR